MPITILQCARVLVLFALAGLLSACASLQPRPDLFRLYETARANTEQPPVIIIPGLMGTLLESPTQGEIWIGSLTDLAFSDYRHAALKIDPDSLMPDPGDVRPAGITGEFAGRDFYQPIIETLENIGGFERAEVGRAVNPNGRYYYVFTYDWRLDNVQSARRLSELVEQIRLDHGRSDLKVDIIAHSMGGMIARYYMRYGTVDATTNNEFPVNYHGAERVRRILLLGTPNMGSVESMKAFIVGRQIGLRRIPPEVMLTFPSFYQLFPHPLGEWLIDIEGQPVDADPFDIETWQQYGWSIYDPRLRNKIIDRFDDRQKGEDYMALLERYFYKQIERGRRFMWSLTVELDRRPWELVVFGGDCTLTPARMVVEHTGQEYMLHLNPNAIRSPTRNIDYERLMMEPGDGLVTKSSLLARQTLDSSVPRHRWSYFPIDYPLFLCEEHSQLTNNTFFQNNLLHFLLNPDAVPATVEVRR